MVRVNITLTKNLRMKEQSTALMRVCKESGEEADDEDSMAANVTKNPITPAVTSAAKEKRKPFFRRVSLLCSLALSLSLSLCVFFCLCVLPLLHCTVGVVFP